MSRVRAAHILGIDEEVDPVDAERDRYLRAQLEPGEREAAAGRQGLVTDRRILFAWRLHWPPNAGEWTHDAVAFDEVTSWAIGRRHDERPVLRLTHPPHVRLEWAPAHHVLWMRWGNRTAPISHTDTTLEFGRSRDPLLGLIRTRLEQTRATQGKPFVVLLPGTRTSRTARSRTYIFESRTKRRWQRARRRVAMLDERLHNGQIAWPIRVGSWLLVAVPAWFIRPWLAPAAIVVVEVAWVVGLQWSARKDRRRRATPSGY